MKLSIKAGATSQSVNVFIQNSTSTTGAGLTGLAFNTASLTAYYSFSGASAGSVVIALATLATLGTAWSTGGFLQIDSTNMPGWYRLDLPNAVLAAASGRSVSIHLQGAANMAPCPIEIELTGWDNQDAVHGGMSALPNTAVTTNASLLTSGAGTDQISNASGKVLLQATQTGVTIPTVTTLTNLPSIPANWLTAAGINAGALNGKGDWLLAANVPSNFAALGISVAGKISEVVLCDTLTTYTSNTPQTGDSFARLGAPAGASVSADIAAIKSDTGTILTDVNTGAGAIYTRLGTPAGASMSADIASVKSSVGSVTGAVGSVTGAVGSVTGAVGSITGVTFPSGFSTLTTAAIATAIFTDTTAGDFTTPGSLGHIVITQLGGTFTTTSSSIFTVAALANGPAGGGGGGGGATTAQIWQDLLSSADFATPGSIGALLKANVIPPVTSIPNFPFFLALNSDGRSPAIGKAGFISASRSIDGGAFAPCTNTATETGNGCYQINLSTQDLAYTNSVLLLFAAPGCETTILTIVPN